ncbi:GerAB/ArcD/ProY family transporter [Fictibacillus barbaricus]|uniref:GerAB/ArcD/ProY family transporter n=1 Tax=Fictibacillus barbaricus TaxID=182136 RepID=A0ABS2ZC93_9BACL|nr:GerAB/ArcD/ProY family transporter [Fictibacillus barbaricus]MBN3544944.1 GerAB/ArcD/ProY family transporter [Fictibacillus barbaricus]GGB62903.1 germination protein GerB [Fictibacillus barbaricus]
MKVLLSIKQEYLLNAFMIFFIVHSTQIGVGIQGYQRIIYSDSHQDAWISVILSGLYASLIVYIIIKTLELYETSDIYGIQHDVFGKLIGKLLNVLYIFYSLISFFVVLRNYMEVVQAWIFPEVPLWFLTTSLLMLVIYGIHSGVRGIAGIAFFSVTLSLWLLILIIYPLQHAKWTYLLPVLEADLIPLLKGVYHMTFTVIGFEILYTVYPYMKDKNKVQKYAQLAILFTTCIYTILMMVAIVYFSGAQLERTVWATLSLFKVVRLPFIERFEYVAITFWMLIILPNLILYMWAACRGMERVFTFSAKKSVWLFSSIIFIITQFVISRTQINMMNGYFAKFAFVVVFCYPLILFLAAWLKKKFTKKKEQSV